MPNVGDAGVVERVFVAWNLRCRCRAYVHLVPEERPRIVAQVLVDHTSERLMTTDSILWDNRTVFGKIDGVGGAN